jgi:hypothetical protein
MSARAGERMTGVWGYIVWGLCSEAGAPEPYLAGLGRRTGDEKGPMIKSNVPVQARLYGNQRD